MVDNENKVEVSEEASITPSEEKTLEQKIEEKRVPIFEQFNKSKKMSNILTIVVLIFAVGGMLLVNNEATWMQILGWGLMIAGIALMIVYYFTNKKKFEANTRDYIAFVAKTLNEESFRGEGFKNVEVTDAKVEVNDLAGNGAYTDIIRVASRNVSNGEYCGIRFTFAEIAFFKKGEKKGQQETMFVGKYIDALNALKFDGNIIIEFGGEKPIDMPNGVEGKAVLFEEGNFKIYGDEGLDYKAIIGEHFVSLAKALPVVNHLLNVVISIWEGHTFVFLSYDDAVIAIPFDKPFSAEAYQSFVADLNCVMHSLEFLGK